MKKQFDILRKTRKFILENINGLSNAQLTKVPVGFNNNIQWNVVHLLVTQQLLCYKLAKEPFIIDENLVEQFRKGTIPQAEFALNDSDFAKIKTQFLAVVEQLEKDYNEGKFKNYSPYMTSMKVELCNIEDAINFNLMHEGWHLGSILALKRLV